MKPPKTFNSRPLRAYEPIWKQIKTQWPKEVAVKIHNSAVKRLRQAVRKEKSKEVAFMRAVGELTYGPLIERVEPDKSSPDHSIVYFSISYSEKDI